MQLRRLRSIDVPVAFDYRVLCATYNYLSPDGPIVTHYDDKEFWPLGCDLARSPKNVELGRLQHLPPLKQISNPEELRREFLAVPLRVPDVLAFLNKYGHFGLAALSLKEFGVWQDIVRFLLTSTGEQWKPRLRRLLNDKPGFNLWPLRAGKRRFRLK